MTEDIYANSGLTADHRRRSDSSGHSYEDIYANEDAAVPETRSTKRSSGTVTEEDIEVKTAENTDPQNRGKSLLTHFTLSILNSLTGPH